MAKGHSNIASSFRSPTPAITRPYQPSWSISFHQAPLRAQTRVQSWGDQGQRREGAQHVGGGCPVNTTSGWNRGLSHSTHPCHCTPVDCGGTLENGFCYLQVTGQGEGRRNRKMQPWSSQGCPSGALEGRGDLLRQGTGKT